MDPHGGTTGGGRAEAERWLVIAEKLLAGRDLVGCRSFAIRARESDPTLDAADQILAVSDTLIAGEKRIHHYHDWYAILQLPHVTADLGLIATHYRQLAILLNPHRNRLPFADEAFKLVYDAWSVLLNPSEKSIYDNELTVFAKYGPAAMGRSQEQEQPPPPPSPPPPPPPPKPQTQPQPPPHQPQQQNDSRPSPKIINSSNKEMNVNEGSESHDNRDENGTFWTACPYCYNMYEYPRVYEDCSLRCQGCRRAFHGAKIQAPTPIVEGKEAYFSCWGFFPLGVSMANLEKNKGGVPNWAPFSPMFTCPQIMDKGNVGKKKKVNAQKGPWIYIDDDDAFLDISESSEDSDIDWGSTKKKKKKLKKMKGKRSAGKYVKKSRGEKVKKVKRATRVNDVQGGPVMQEVMGAPSVSNAETSRKAAANSAKKQTGKVPKERGKLDLNVEFSNEVEEAAPGVSERNKAGNGEEDGIEGIGFFEGLDEFFSSLPILKATQ
ncbi:chaperone DnaJ-domain superfamily protein [Actinidia rufa]|uniref:Chaperone DnaJ-domain superfamily protein n=1 Tax=Actinidia rufa TaxID=165716 RepID=A0A7J0DIW2_9ERIC|nr:chaperone DnaJ-domain superfamily protein [Actinidia rufa]